jgi:hypothetical protein
MLGCVNLAAKLAGRLSTFGRQFQFMLSSSHARQHISLSNPEPGGPGGNGALTAFCRKDGSRADFR